MPASSNIASRSASALLGHLPLLYLLRCCAAACAIGVLLSAAAEDAGRPNVVLFLVDDMGWQDTSVAFGSEPTASNRHFRTPNMERLAAQGVRFTSAYSHAVCSPTRTSIMTGQNPARHGVTNWTLRAGVDTSGGWGRVGSPAKWRTNGLQPSSGALSEVLQDAGYFTIHCGKAHWGARGTKGSNPLNLGFDVNIAGHAAGAPGSYQGAENFGNDEQSSPWGVPGLKAYHGEEVHLTDACTIEAKKAMSRAVDAEQPFYLYLAHYAVHVPIQPHERHMGAYRDQSYSGTEREIPVEEARYASMIAGMDASLGEIMAHCEELGVGENTLIIFTSDNGGLSVHGRGATPRGTGADTHNWPLRSGKGSAYEGGTRVPFLVAWAQTDPSASAQKSLPLVPGTTSDQPLICEDLFPTVLGVAGVDVPDGHSVDGRDVRAYWLRRESDPERALLFHYPHVWGPKGPGYEPHSAMRKGKWKLIYFYNARRWELYDLSVDVGEQDNLADRERARLCSLATVMRGELERMGAQWPVDRESGLADEPDWPSLR